MTAQPTCWVITDGRRGIENQALGLAEACARIRPLAIEKHVVESGKPFKALPATLQSKFKSNPAQYGLTPPYPDLAIGCGRQAIAPLIALKQEAGDAIFTVYVQHPRVNVDLFDLVIAPEHDQLTGDNVETMIGSPNRVTKNAIIAAVLEFGNRLANLPMPRVTMLIGGESKTHDLTKNIHETHMKVARNILASDRSLLLTTSRRTPAFAVEAYMALAETEENMWLYNGDGPNPYFAFLGGADTILITEESTNMLTEACATGKPVFSLPMDGNPGKFTHLYEALEQHCGLRPYDTILTGRDYKPLLETDRIAKQLWARFNQRDGLRI